MFRGNTVSYLTLLLVIQYARYESNTSLETPYSDVEDIETYGTSSEESGSESADINPSTLGRKNPFFKAKQDTHGDSPDHSRLIMEKAPIVSSRSLKTNPTLTNLKQRPTASNTDPSFNMRSENYDGLPLDENGYTELPKTALSISNQTGREVPVLFVTQPSIDETDHPKLGKLEKNFLDPDSASETKLKRTASLSRLDQIRAKRSLEPLSIQSEPFTDTKVDTSSPIYDFILNKPAYLEVCQDLHETPPSLPSIQNRPSIPNITSRVERGVWPVPRARAATVGARPSTLDFKKVKSTNFNPNNNLDLDSSPDTPLDPSRFSTRQRKGFLGSKLVTLPGPQSTSSKFTEFNFYKVSSYLITTSEDTLIVLIARPPVNHPHRSYRIFLATFVNSSGSTKISPIDLFLSDKYLKRNSKRQKCKISPDVVKFRDDEEDLLKFGFPQTRIMATIERENKKYHIVFIRWVEKDGSVKDDIFISYFEQGKKKVELRKKDEWASEDKTKSIREKSSEVKNAEGKVVGRKLKTVISYAEKVQS